MILYSFKVMATQAKLQPQVPEEQPEVPDNILTQDKHRLDIEVSDDVMPLLYYLLVSLLRITQRLRDLYTLCSPQSVDMR